MQMLITGETEYEVYNKGFLCIFFQSFCSKIKKFI